MKRAALLILLVIVAAGCGSTTTSSQPTTPPPPAAESPVALGLDTQRCVDLWNADPANELAGFVGPTRAIVSIGAVCSVEIVVHTNHRYVDTSFIEYNGRLVSSYQEITRTEPWPASTYNAAFNTDGALVLKDTR